MRRLAIAMASATAVVALVACGTSSNPDRIATDPTGESGTGILGVGPTTTPATATPTAAPPSQPKPKSTIDSKAGYAWIANGAGSYVVSTNYQYNSAGGEISVAHTATGVYAVRFNGLGSPGGVAHAQAYGVTPNFCTVGGWYVQGADQSVAVNCFAPDGTAADTQFTVSFAVGSMGAARFSYVWADQPTNTSRYKPSAEYVYDAVKSSDVTVQRKDVGRYEVYLPASGPLSAPWTFQVTGYGSVTQCKLAGFSSSNRKAQVACRDTDGNFADTRFALTFASGASFLGRTDRPFGAFNEDNDGLENPATGSYTVRATNLGQDMGQVVVVARGSAATYCHTRSWNSSGADLSAYVVCFNPGGAPASSGFELAVTL